MEPRLEILEMVEPLRAFARRFHRDPQDADDLVQETLLRALANLDTFTPGTSMKSWLFTIMRNAFYNHIRVYNRERPALSECVSSHGTTHASQEISVECSEVLAAIRSLPLPQKEVVVLISIFGLPYQDAAEICDCRLGTVQSRLFRARSRLHGAPLAA